MYPFYLFCIKAVGENVWNLFYCRKNEKKKGKKNLIKSSEKLSASLYV